MLERLADEVPELRKDVQEILTVAKAPQAG
ncbi:hypothetical protein SAMN05216553_101405 [Lentzea fradiae]|uniref:Uncharacterized protein n=2 Tax=Lentzea fradiae TaxID=200378 RepID=A0A1G7KPH8_9PSEU|nr:hypothetical protein SAMN05216553_101405 [Lentzea fradiae]